MSSFPLERRFARRAAPELARPTPWQRFAGVLAGAALVALALGVAIALGLVYAAATDAQDLLLPVCVGAGCLLALAVAFAMGERGRLLDTLARTQSRYRLLAEHSRDLVLRMTADGSRLYVSPAITSVLGWSEEEFRRARWDLVHPDDAAATAGALSRLYADGGTETIACRMQHRDGHHLWVEVIGSRVENPDPGAPAEIIASVRDISQRMAARAALAETQERLRAVTDNMPALIAYVDADERYAFANAHYERLLGVATDSIVGRGVRESAGEAAYALWAPHIAGALRGESQVFEREPDASTGQRYLQSNYVPDVAPDGTVRGFYALTFDITRLKDAERELERQARVDALTGLGNRRGFEEWLETAIARSRRHRTPLALISLDLDRFKQINDTLGHPVGDRVLQAFAERLRTCVYDVDLVARLGGDEFMVLVEDAPSAEVAELIAQKLLAAMAEPIPLEAGALQVSTSIGIAFAGNAPSATALLAQADKALYAAKSAGRNTYRLLTA